MQILFLGKGSDGYGREILRSASGPLSPSSQECGCPDRGLINLSFVLKAKTLLVLLFLHALVLL